MSKSSVKHFTNSKTVKHLNVITQTITWISQIQVSLKTVSSEKIKKQFANILHSYRTNEMRQSFTKLLMFLLDQCDKKFHRLHAYYLYKFLMLVWHDFSLIALMKGCTYNRGVHSFFVSDTSWMSKLSSILTKIYIQIDKEDWKNLDSFLLGATILTLSNSRSNEHTANDVLRKIITRIDQRKFFDGHYLIAPKYCCEQSSTHYQTWSTHVSSALLRLILALSI